MQQVKWNTRFNFRSAEPSEVVQFSVGVNTKLSRGLDFGANLVHRLKLHAFGNSPLADCTQVSN